MRHLLASLALAIFAGVVTSCGNDSAGEQDSMAPLLEKAAREQGLDRNKVISRDKAIPQVDPKLTQKNPAESTK